MANNSKIFKVYDYQKGLDDRMNGVSIFPLSKEYIEDWKVNDKQFAEDIHSGKKSLQDFINALKDEDIRHESIRIWEVSEFHRKSKYYNNDFRDLTDPSGKTILDFAKEIGDEELVKKLEEHRFITGEAAKIQEFLRENFFDSDIDYFHKNIQTGDRCVFSINDNEFYVNSAGASGLFIIDRDVFLRDFASEIDKNYPDINSENITIDKIKEIIDNQKDVTLGDKISLAGLYWSDRNMSMEQDKMIKIIISEFDNSPDIMKEDNLDNIKGWKDFVKDGSIDKISEVLKDDSSLSGYFNIIDKNGQTALDAVIEAGDIELSDKLSKIGVLSAEEVIHNKEDEFNKSVNNEITINKNIEIEKKLFDSYDYNKDLLERMNEIEDDNSTLKKPLLAEKICVEEYIKDFSYSFRQVLENESDVNKLLDKRSLYTIDKNGETLLDAARNIGYKDIDKLEDFGFTTREEANKYFEEYHSSRNNDNSLLNNYLNEQGYSFREILSMNVDINDLMDSKLRFAVDKNGETLLDAANNINYENIDIIKESGFVTKDVVNTYEKLNKYFEENGFEELRNVDIELFDQDRFGNGNVEFGKFKCEATLINENQFVLSRDIPDYIYNNASQIDYDSLLNHRAAVVDKDEFLKMFAEKLHRDNIYVGEKELNSDDMNKILGNFYKNPFVADFYAISGLDFDYGKNGFLKSDVYNNMILKEFDNGKSWNDILNEFESFRIKHFSFMMMDTLNNLDSNGKTALDAAIDNGNLLTYKYLIEAGALKGEQLENVGSIKSEMNREDILKLLENHMKPDVDFGYFSHSFGDFENRRRMERVDDVFDFFKENINNGNLVFNDFINDSIRIKDFDITKFGLLVDKNGETLFDNLEKSDNPYIKEIVQSDNYLSSDVIRIYNCLKDNILSDDFDLLHKSFNINGADIYCIDKEQFFVSGDVKENSFKLNDDFCLEREDFLISLASEINKNNPSLDTYNLTFDKINEVMKFESNVTLGDRIEAMENSSINYKETLSFLEEYDIVRKSIISEFDNSFSLNVSEKFDNIKSWQDLVEDGSVTKMSEYLKDDSRYFNIVDKNGETALDATIKAGELELSDKLIKIGAMTNEEIENKVNENIKDNVKDNQNDNSNEFDD